MTANINWANPVYGPDANNMSKAYLARLQAFLESQSPATGGTGNGSGGATTESHKRKNPSTENEVDTATAVKDRKQAGAATTKHSHTKEGSSERESPDEEEGNRSGKLGKGNSTTDKRKEQNRNAQRAFRERKEKVLRDMEDKVNEMKEINEKTLSENQNLKDLITRLQQENAQLKKAPQSEFTFSMPGAAAYNSNSDSNNFTNASAAAAVNNNSTAAGPSTNDAPRSYSNDDILAFLSSAPANQPSQPAFTMIDPSSSNANSTGSNNIQQGQGQDSWMFDWNSSAFGTELPQAVPPSVTNLALQPTVDTGIASFWNSLNQQSQQPMNQYSTSPVNSFNNTSTSNNNIDNNNNNKNLNAPSRPQDNSSAFFSLFQNAFVDPSPTSESTASASNNSPYSSMFNAGNSTTTPSLGGQPLQNMRSGSSDLFPFATSGSGSGSGTGSGSGIGGNSGSNANAVGPNSVMNAHLSRMTSNSNSNDQSPASASSTSGSSPSDAQPGTPNNGASIFAGGNVKGPVHTNSTDSNSSSSFHTFAMPNAFPNLYGNQSVQQQQQVSPQTHLGTTGFESMFGGSSAADFNNVTTPSGVFDAMNYRDPLLNGLGGAGDDGFNFASFINNGNNSGGINAGKKQPGDVLDFNDFLVASPPSLTQSPAPIPPYETGHAPLTHTDSRSSSSVPTLGSYSTGNSPHSNQHSPRINASSSNYANSTASGSSNVATPDWLPYDISAISSDHPLIAHVMKDRAGENEQEAAKQRLLARGAAPCEVDSLCSDMMMKATCKEAARYRIEKSIQTDEMTMKLYNDFLRSNEPANNGSVAGEQ